MDDLLYPADDFGNDSLKTSVHISDHGDHCQTRFSLVGKVSHLTFRVETYRTWAFQRKDAWWSRSEVRIHAAGSKSAGFMVF